MLEVTHTPGPWNVEPIGNDPLCILAGEGADQGSPVSHIATVQGDYAHGVAEANAQLIASAPDLLKACDLALRILDRDGLTAIRGEAWTDGEYEQIRQAVVSATAKSFDPEAEWEKLVSLAGTATTASELSDGARLAEKLADWARVHGPWKSIKWSGPTLQFFLKSLKNELDRRYDADVVNML